MIYLDNYKKMEIGVKSCQKVPKQLYVEGASAATKKELIKGLNEDLSREYKAIIQYVVFSSTLKGAEYGRHCRPVESACLRGTRARSGGCKADRLFGWGSDRGSQGC